MSPTLVIALPALLLGASVVVALLTVRLERASGDRLRARRAEQPLAHELPYWAFLDDDGAAVVVNVDLTYSAVLELQGLDADCMDNEALNHAAAALHGTIQNLTDGALLQFLHWTDSDVGDALRRYASVAEADGGIGGRLVNAKVVSIVDAGGLRRSRLLLAVSAPNRAQSPAARELGFVKRWPRTSPALHEDAVRELRTIREQVARSLQAAGLRSRPLTVAEAKLVAYELLNPDRAHLVPDPWAALDAVAWSDAQSAREQLLFTGIEEKRDRLVHGGRLVRVLTLKSLPTWTEPALFEVLAAGLPFHARVHIAIEALDSLKALDGLKRRRDQAHLLATLREKRNQEAEAQEADVAELIDRNLQSSIRMVRVAVSVVLSVDASAPDAPVLLERQTAEVLRILSSLHGAQGMVDELCQLDEFLATLPGNARAGRRWRQCTSENASHLLLAWQSWSGAGDPVVLLQNGRAGLVGLDPFNPELDNPNAFMAGASGAGKSATTNYLLLNLLASGAKALVVDVGGSYRRIIELFGGSYFAINVDAGADQALNPFFAHADIVTADGRLEERRLQFELAVVERMVCDHARTALRNTERAVLAQAVTALYAWVTDRTPILSDLVHVLRNVEFADKEDSDIARGLARDLRLWIDGPAARLVNRPSTIELTTDIAAFDLKGLEGQEHLRSVVMLILSGVIWNLVMRDPNERKMVVFVECWKFLESPASAQLVAELYRTSRKYRTSILTISQSVEDFTSSSIANALTNNSATVYLLKHRRGHDIVAAQFKLNERERYVFESLEMRRGEYTEALVLHGDHHFLARVVLSPLEYWTTTTHPADRAIEDAYRRRHPHLGHLELLELLASDYPKGAASADGDARAA